MMFYYVMLGICIVAGLTGQILLKAGKRTTLRDTLRTLKAFAEKEKWRSTALVIDVDPISLT